MTKKSRSQSSRRWLQEHFNDEYVKLAQQRGYRSRAVFKLEEIQQKYRLLKPGMVVVDLGAAPGGWSQYAREVVTTTGHVIALDLLAIESISNVTIVQDDFLAATGLAQLQQCLAGRAIDVVLSDMAPNMSGIAVADQAKSMLLAETALLFAEEQLRIGGHFICKVFQGSGFAEFVQTARRLFTKVLINKPKASRGRSNEVYLLGVGLRAEHKNK